MCMKSKLNWKMLRDKEGQNEKSSLIKGVFRIDRQKQQGGGEDHTTERTQPSRPEEKH